MLQCFHSQHTAIRSQLSALSTITLDMPTHSPGGLRHPTLLATCCPSPYLYLLEEDHPATTSVTTPGLIRIQKRPRKSMDPYEPWDSPVWVSQAW
ncbi:hypothetical protein E2C01_094805 [Portunus trituberculatus]|uniref:Uncharacterized protein n=1 Tax=Portunus trituberculatus TaxID=210409 RepID=A0A5B7JY71_PORTR|nr:hypothetical protein [Portunus trituberculatus]